MMSADMILLSKTLDDVSFDVHAEGFLFLYGVQVPVGGKMIRHLPDLLSRRSAETEGSLDAADIITDEAVDVLHQVGFGLLVIKRIPFFL